MRKSRKRRVNNFLSCKRAERVCAKRNLPCEFSIVQIVRFGRIIKSQGEFT